MILKPTWFIPILVLLVTASFPAYGLTLYETEFEEFNVGPDEWAGTNEWTGTSTGLGVHGIDEDIVPGLEKTAFLGFNRPAGTFVTVFRPLTYDPVSNATPTVEFETLMGIEDSTNGFRDSFFFTFYNIAGDFLAAVRFDNTDLNYGVWRLDGTSQFDTGVEFIRGEVHLLFTSINFSNNTWSADLDGIPLFTGTQFNATSKTLDLGFVAAEWQLSSSSTNEHGDNWMLIADWDVRAFPVSDTPFDAEDIILDEQERPAISWTGAVGFDYTVEYSGDLVSWHADLPGGLYTNILAKTPLTFADSTNAPFRCYRINRSLAP